MKYNFPFNQLNRLNPHSPALHEIHTYETIIIGEFISKYVSVRDVRYGILENCEFLLFSIYERKKIDTKKTLYWNYIWIHYLTIYEINTH